MRNAPCNVCGEHICVCAKQLPDTSYRTSHGMKLCAWATAGKLCNMIANGDQTRCNWHNEWKTILEGGTDKSEYQALDEWLELFRPGGHYGHNPGQWWAPIRELVDALHGLGPTPRRTEQQRRIRDGEHRAAMDAQRKAKVGA